MWRPSCFPGCRADAPLRTVLRRLQATAGVDTRGAAESQPCSGRACERALVPGSFGGRGRPPGSATQNGPSYRPSDGRVGPSPRSAQTRASPVGQRSRVHAGRREGLRLLRAGLADLCRGPSPGANPSSRSQAPMQSIGGDTAKESRTGSAKPNCLAPGQQGDTPRLDPAQSARGFPGAQTTGRPGVAAEMRREPLRRARGRAIRHTLPHRPAVDRVQIGPRRHRALPGRRGVQQRCATRTRTHDRRPRQSTAHARRVTRGRGKQTAVPGLETRRRPR